MAQDMQDLEQTTGPSKPKLTYLKPVKEYKKLDCVLPFRYLYWTTLEELNTQLEDFREKLNQFKEEGWEGIMDNYDKGHPVVNLYKTHFVEDEEYDRAITAALQNKPSWDDLEEEVMAIGLPLWECDYQYEWTFFYHTDPSNCSFVENRPKTNDN
jgi:hypothetical protein